MYKLFGEPGWGSALIEAQLQWYQLPFEFESVGDLFRSHGARERLTRVNPLAQIPTLVMPDGQVITESAAITLYLADITKSDELVPAADSPERCAFLRWLVFLIANIYPTFTYKDDPSRFVTDKSAQEDFSKNVGQYRSRLWKIVEEAVQTEQFPTNRSFSALDIYLCVMTRWQPGRDWFAQHCPAVYNIARRVDGHPKLMACWQHNFPE
ncbi:glutathione S-transferase N-terminal domain-containing protein [Lacimicrobium alkaliphilum]|uniref:GST N-terminal domain-containing protein n=1 Tax=Lacimicrobium alkaliphilum TaxID=1526571 RepID=A0A0U3AYR3_9ALTE|nr:glutathione S-transferase [Lacimicrobium alkaliphilum]ALS98120.1 hypothetical protein AT746_07465 [Lacimicrobium alkaliphilum]